MRRDWFLKVSFCHCSFSVIRGGFRDLRMWFRRVLFRLDRFLWGFIGV